MNDHFTSEELEILKQYVTNLDGSVYCLKNLPEEVVSVIFAYVSRSPNSFRKNLLSLISGGDVHLNNKYDLYGDDDLEEAKNKAQKFHEKWVVGYGHGSVAEHTDLKFAIDELSILATKVLEDNRLGRFTEKSTRYQIMDKNHYYKCPTIMKSLWAEQYVTTLDHLFEVYGQFTQELRGFVEQRYPRRPEQSEPAYANSVKAKVCDIARYLLPTATLTMMATSLNARTAEHALVKMRSSVLAEVRELGEKMLTEGRKISPTLLKYCESTDYYRSWPSVTETAVSQSEKNNAVILHHYAPEAEEKILAALFFQHENLAYDEAQQRAKELSAVDRLSYFQKILQGKNGHDPLPRAFELAHYTMEIVVDYGAFRDIQRHRMNTQVNQLLTPANGYEVPAEIMEAGLEKRYREAIERAGELAQKMSQEFPYEAQYVLPLAYRVRVLFDWNFRALEHFIRLRSSPQGHISYRRIAQQVYQKIVEVHPQLATFLTVDMQDYGLGRLAAEEKKAKPV